MAYTNGGRRRAPRPARWMDLLYAGNCHVCGTGMSVGTRGFYDPETRQVTCAALVCAEKDSLTTQVWSGSPTSGRWATRLNDRRIGPRWVAPLEEEDDYEGGGQWHCNHDVPGGCPSCRQDRNEHAAIEAMTENERRDYLYDGYSPEEFFAPGGPAFLKGL